MSKPLSLFFLIRSLEIGGAERQLVLLATQLHRRGHHVTVATMYDRGPLAADLDAAGVPIVCLKKRGRWDNAGFLWRLLRAARASGAALLHGYTTVPNLYLLAVRLVLPGRKVVWGIRASMTDFSSYGYVSKMVFRLSCRASPFAELVIANSWRAAEECQAAGLRPRRLAVVPNGVDTDRFAPDTNARERWRSEWGFDSATLVVGLVGRLDPAKDHESFITAISILRRAGIEAVGVCVGPGEDRYWRRLAVKASALRIADCVRWLGPSAWMPGVYNGIDVLCLASTSEGFPNVVAEAMACGCRCVVTDVGDAARLVDRLGIVVPARDPIKLAAGLAHALAESNSSASADRRRRIEINYSVQALQTRTESALATLVR